MAPFKQTKQTTFRSRTKTGEKIPEACLLWAAWCHCRDNQPLFSFPAAFFKKHESFFYGCCCENCQPRRWNEMKVRAEGKRVEWYWKLRSEVSRSVFVFRWQGEADIQVYIAHSFYRLKGIWIRMPDLLPSKLVDPVASSPSSTTRQKLNSCTIKNNSFDYSNKNNSAKYSLS